MSSRSPLVPRTRTRYVCPGVSRRKFATCSSESRPSTARIVSPTVNPAAAAGDPSSTAVTTCRPRLRELHENPTYDLAGGCEMLTVSVVAGGPGSLRGDVPWAEAQPARMSVSRTAGTAAFISAIGFLVLKRVGSCRLTSTGARHGRGGSARGQPRSHRSRKGGVEPTSGRRNFGRMSADPIRLQDRGSDTSGQVESGGYGRVRAEGLAGPLAQGWHPTCPASSANRTHGDRPC